MASSTVIVLSSDLLIEKVIRHLLPVQQYDVVRRDCPEEVINLLVGGGRLAVLDIPEADADSLALIRRVHAEGGKPIVVLTDHPEQLAGRVEPAVRVLGRPPELADFQAAIHAAVAEPTAAAVPTNGETPFGKLRHRVVGFVGGAVLAVLAFALLGPLLGVPGMPNVVEWLVAKKEEDKARPPLSVTLLPGRTDAFELPDDVVKQMNLPRKPFTVESTAQPRTLTLSGTLAFDPDRLARIQSRFPGEVVAVGTADAKPIDVDRQSPLSPLLQYGNFVHKGAPLAVVWCKDLGEKKSELVDALSQLSLDKETLKKLEELDTVGGTSQAVLRQAQRNVSASLNAVNKAERALRTWRVSEDEINAVKEEARRIIERKGKRDPEREKGWARVEILSPIDGVVVEKNIVRGNIVDTTQDLFKIADLTSLAVYAHVYEEDQPELQDLQKKMTAKGKLLPWQLYLTSDPNKQLLSSPGIKRLGLIVDPNQHTNFALGIVDNHDGRLRVGQFVTAVVELPAPPDVVSIPVSALDEDGETSHVLVQLEPRRHRYALRRVRVVRRYLDFAYVSSKLTDSDRAAGLTELAPGELIVTGGAVQLKAALEEARARAKAQK